MEQQGFKWQILAGGLLLVVLIGSLFFPVFKISGESYLSAVYDVNTHAEKQNLTAAKKAGTKEITDNFQKNTTKRRDKAAEFDSEIEKKSDRISGIEFIKWSFSDSKLNFSGVNYTAEKDIEKSGVKSVFRMMGMLLLFPVLLGICNLVFMLVRRKIYAGWLIATGLSAVVCSLVFCKGMPGMIWERSAPYVKSFTMISDKTLLIKGLGKYTIQTMVSEFISASVYMELIAGGLLIISGILFMTVWKPKSVTAVQTEEEIAPAIWDDAGEVKDLKTQWGDFQAQEKLRQREKAPESANVVTNIKLKGKIYGIKGEYQGSEIEVAEGEEIVLGRDPKYCELVFAHKQVSRKHCGIRYDGEKRAYQVIDYSTNGTVFADGGMARAGVYTSVPSGTVIDLAGGEEKIQLGKRRYGDAPDSNMRR